MIERDGPAEARASNGQPYITLMIGGIKEEGERQNFVVLASAGECDMNGLEKAEEAVRALFDKELETFLASQTGDTIEWRKRPELISHHNWDGSVAITMRARLAVLQSEAVAA